MIKKAIAKFNEITHNHDLMMKVCFFGILLNLSLSYVLLITSNWEAALVVFLATLGYVVSFLSHLLMKKIKIKKAAKKQSKK